MSKRLKRVRKRGRGGLNKLGGLAVASRREKVQGQEVLCRQSWDDLFAFGKKLKERTGLTREDSAKLLAEVRKKLSGNRS